MAQQEPKMGLSFFFFFIFFFINLLDPAGQSSASQGQRVNPQCKTSSSPIERGQRQP